MTPVLGALIAKINVTVKMIFHVTLEQDSVLMGSVQKVGQGQIVSKVGYFCTFESF